MNNLIIEMEIKGALLYQTSVYKRYKRIVISNNFCRVWSRTKGKADSCWFSTTCQLFWNRHVAERDFLWLAPDHGQCWAGAPPSGNTWNDSTNKQTCKTLIKKHTNKNAVTALYLWQYHFIAVIVILNKIFKKASVLGLIHAESHDLQRTPHSTGPPKAHLFGSCYYISLFRVFFMNEWMQDCEEIRSDLFLYVQVSQRLVA